MTGPAWFGPYEASYIGLEHDLLGAELDLDRVMDDPAAAPDQITAAEGGVAEARAAWEDACAAADRQAEADRQARAAEAGADGPEPEASS